MKANVGTGDKIFRVIVGLGIIGAGVYFQSWWGAIGLVPLLTAMFGFCPAYLPFGLSTCATPAEKTE
jgi:hypothetical protein